MRTLKLITALTLVMAIGASAWAVNLPAGPIWFKNNNYDMGTIYSGTPGTYDPADFTVWDGQGVPPAGAWKLPAPGAIGAEDGWGVFFVQNMFQGQVQPDGYITQGAILPFFSAGQNGEHLVGIFWGLQDQTVTINADGTWDVSSTGLNFELWLTNGPAPFPPSAGSAGRLAANQYNGWVPDGGTLVAAGTSVSYEFSSTADAPNVEGQTTMYLAVDPNQGIWGKNLDADWYDFAYAGADIYLSWQTRDINLSDWTAYSTDEASAYVVPEPMTMLGVMMGVGGLVGYIRRRRA